MGQKKWTVKEIQTMLEENPKAVVRGVVAIYELQTESEQSMGATVENNGRGYNMYDAEIMTSFADQILAGRTLTARQFDVAKRRIRKYARQLTKIANGEIRG